MEIAPIVENPVMDDPDPGGLFRVDRETPENVERGKPLEMMESVRIGEPKKKAARTFVPRFK